MISICSISVYPSVHNSVQLHDNWGEKKSVEMNHMDLCACAVLQTGERKAIFMSAFPTGDFTHNVAFCMADPYRSMAH